jgi:GT2 family glycosyltransferase
MTPLGVMPTFLRSEDDLSVTIRAVQSFRGTCGADLLVVDDHSEDLDLVDALDAACKEAGADFEYRVKNEGFSRTVNVGLRRARRMERDAVLVNADIEFINNGWLEALLGNPADVVGALLLYPNRLVQHAGIYYSVISRQFDHILKLAPMSLAQVSEPRICPVTGALQLIRWPTLKRVGIYDENFRMGYEDVDYCHIVFQAGLKCAYEPSAQAIHHEGMFRWRDPSEKVLGWMAESWAYLHRKHAGVSFAEYVPTLLEWPDDSQE